MKLLLFFPICTVHEMSLTHYNLTKERLFVIGLSQKKQMVAFLSGIFNVTNDDFEQLFLCEHDANGFHLPSVVSRMQLPDLMKKLTIFKNRLYMFMKNSV